MRLAAREDDAPVIGKTLGNYRITGKLGAGGMGEVYRADDLKLGRTVALKFIRGELLGDPEIRRRFEREARSLAALDHPYVGIVHGLEEDEGQHFMVLAFVEGPSLAAILREGPLPPSRAAVLLPRIAEGLGAAHERGIVHRDVKSSNILVGKNDVPRLVDFGLALREQDTRVTRFGEATVGTLAYMAPEVLRGAPANARSDLFSLGVVLYESLTGRLPFERPTPAATLHAILNEEPPPFPGTLPPASRSLETVVRRCLEKDPARRFPDAGAVAAVLTSRDATAGSAVPKRAGALSVARRVRIVLLVSALAILALGASRLVRQRAATAPAQQREHSVAVLEFENVTGDASFDWMERGLAELLGTALSRSEDLDVYDPQRLANLRPTAGDRSNRAASFESLKRSGIGRAVVGSVVRSGGRLRIQGRVIEVKSGRVLHSEWVEGGVGDDLFRLAGGLIKGLQTALEVDLIGLETGDQWLREITTSSVDAYRLFLSGRQAFVASHWAEAARYYEQTLGLDSTFVAARIDLTGCYWNLEDETQLNGSLQAGHRLRNRASRREGLQLDLIAAVVSLDPEQIIRVATELRGLYPENRFFTYLLGRGYYTAKRYQQCLEVLEPLVRERYEWAWTYVLTARAHAQLGHDDEARRQFELGMGVSHANPELAYEFAKFLQQRGDAQQARSLLESAERSPQLPQTPYYESVIRLELGKYYESEGLADSARAEYGRCLARASQRSEEAQAAAEGLRRLGGQ